ncbi:MAG TPA: carboxypeptidase-like regulatory domain-containing protein [Vicinamibacterales bacterium]|nr:carboxypeptidase-like regulatory domain-containing protein [Vicinamibacterales bacterium]
MSTWKSFVLFASLVATVAGLDAQGRATLVPPPRQGVFLAEPWRPASQGDTKIIGQVIDIRQTPVAHARLQLRNLVNGLVRTGGQSDENGEYQFMIDEPGTYVVEMIVVDGYVIALSNAGSVARFETLRTVVQLPGRWEGSARGMVMPQRFTNFVGMSAATSITAQTVAIALEHSIQPVDPGEPVSPFKP